MIGENTAKRGYEVSGVTDNTGTIKSPMISKQTSPDKKSKKAESPTKPKPGMSDWIANGGVSSQDALEQIDEPEPEPKARMSNLRKTLIKK